MWTSIAYHCRSRLCIILPLGSPFLPSFLPNLTFNPHICTPGCLLLLHPYFALALDCPIGPSVIFATFQTPSQQPSSYSHTSGAHAFISEITTFLSPNVILLGRLKSPNLHITPIARLVRVMDISFISRREALAMHTGENS